MTEYSNETVERFSRLVDVRVLGALRIMIVGLGRSGVAVLKRLLEYPIGKIVGIDHDAVSRKERGSVFPSNTNETFKVHAAEALVRMWNPEIAYEPGLLKVSRETRSEFADLAAEANVLFWCADAWSALRDVVDVVHDSMPCVGISMAESGAYGEVAWSFGETSCLACSLDAANRVSVAGAASLPIDVGMVANVAVECALGIVLAGKKGGELFSHLLDPDHSLLIVHNRPNVFTGSTNELVPKLVRLMRVGSVCSVCRRSRT